jgi:hypothetical protein
MLHGFGDPEDYGESRRILWFLAGEFLGVTRTSDSRPEVGGIDPARASAIRSVVGKLFDEYDHAIGSPTEREVINLFIEEALNFILVASEQLQEFRKSLARAKTLELAAGSEPVPKSPKPPKPQ